MKPVASRVRDPDTRAGAADGVYELAIATRPQDVEAAQDFVIAVLGPDGRRAPGRAFGSPGP